MSRGFPAFFRQFWLHFRKNFRKNLFMWQRETNKSMPATGSHNITRFGVQIKQQIKHRSLILHCFMTKVLCKNTSKVLRRMPPCISFFEVLSQLAINLPGRFKPPPPLPSCRAWRRLRCSYYEAQCCHSCLSQSQGERPHQQHLPCIIKRLRWQVWLPASIVDEGGREE